MNTSKKPYRCKYIFRAQKPKTAHKKTNKETLFQETEISNFKKGLSFQRLDEIILDRGKKI